MIYACTRSNHNTLTASIHYHLCQIIYNNLIGFGDCINYILIINTIITPCDQYKTLLIVTFNHIVIIIGIKILNN